jgi:hypothetical protein
MKIGSFLQSPENATCYRFRTCDSYSEVVIKGSNLLWGKETQQLYSKQAGAGCGGQICPILFFVNKPFASIDSQILPVCVIITVA